MGRRTKIPLIVLLGILFFFIAITLYQGCVIVEAHESAMEPDPTEGHEA